MVQEDVDTIQREPHVPVLNGTLLNWLIDQYILRCRHELSDQTTVDGYEAKLRWFKDWWEREGPPRNWYLRQGDFIQFERYLREVVSSRTKRKLSYNTRHDVLRRLGEALRWAQANHYVVRDYSKWLPRAQGQEPRRHAAPLHILERLIHNASHSHVAARDRAMLAVFIGMGLRRAEVANLDVDDLVFAADHSGHAVIHGKRTKARGDGIRHAAFDKATGEILITYLDAMGYEHGPLFRNASNERLTAQGVYKVIKRLIYQAGLQDYLQGCHDLRRAFATHVAKARKGKESAKLLKEQLGHSSYAHTAEKYILFDVEDIRQDLISPISLMSGVAGSS